MTIGFHPLALALLGRALATVATATAAATATTLSATVNTAVAALAVAAFRPARLAHRTAVLRFLLGRAGLHGGGGVGRGCGCAKQVFDPAEESLFGGCGRLGCDWCYRMGYRRSRRNSLRRSHCWCGCLCARCR